MPLRLCAGALWDSSDKTASAAQTQQDRQDPTSVGRPHKQNETREKKFNLFKKEICVLASWQRGRREDQGGFHNIWRGHGGRYCLRAEVSQLAGRDSFMLGIIKCWCGSVCDPLEFFHFPLWD